MMIHSLSIVHTVARSVSRTYISRFGRSLLCSWFLSLGGESRLLCIAPSRRRAIRSASRQFYSCTPSVLAFQPIDISECRHRRHRRPMILLDRDLPTRLPRKSHPDWLRPSQHGLLLLLVCQTVTKKYDTHIVPYARRYGYAHKHTNNDDTHKQSKNQIRSVSFSISLQAILH